MQDTSTHFIQKSLLTLFFVLFTPFAAQAAIVSLDTNPSVPKPHEQVYVQLKSALVNLDAADIYWYVNEELKQNAVGLKNITITTGPVNTPISIDVVIITIDDLRIDKQLVISPKEVDLIWEADTYTPPFYEGRALPSSESTVTIWAKPNTDNQTDSPQYIYQWKDGRVNIISSASGFGKDSIKIASGISNANKVIGLNLTDFSGNIQGVEELTVRSVEPEVLFYKSSPAFGVFYNELLTSPHVFSDTYLFLRAEPYFVPRQDVENGNMQYQWFIGADVPKSGDDTSRDLTLVNNENVTGKVRIQLLAKSAVNWLQKVAGELVVQF